MAGEAPMRQRAAETMPVVPIIARLSEALSSYCAPTVGLLPLLLGQCSLHLLPNARHGRKLSVFLEISNDDSTAWRTCAALLGLRFAY